MFGWFKKSEPAKKSRVSHLSAVEYRPRDCHSHVIPDVDDGSRNMEESLQMLQMLAEQGAKRVIATSHIYPARFPNEPEELRGPFERLCEEAQKASIQVELELGAEHYLDNTFLDRIRARKIISFGPENYVLFETHTTEQAPVDLSEVVHTLSDAGFTPLMAHIERYHYLRDEDGLELCEDLRAAGAKFQVNRTVGKVNLPGHGPRGKFISILLENDWIDEVGSDLHRPTKSGRPE